MSAGYDVRGKTVLITGAARGIGAATARELDRRGARLALTDVRTDLVEDVAAGLSDAAAFTADVTREDQLQAAVAGAVERFGGIDVVIANAGIGPIGSLQSLPAEVFERTIEINLLGVYRTLRLALPHVIERRGYVVAIASLAAPLHPPLMAHYAASKAGTEALANSLRIEVAHEGVGVGVAYFAYIGTDMVAEAMADPATVMLRGQLKGPLGKNYPPEGAARAVARGIERRARTIVYPRSVTPLLLLRGFIQPLTERVAARRGAGDAVRGWNERASARAGSSTSADPGDG